mgnify:CR=1 FL=1
MDHGKKMVLVPREMLKLLETKQQEQLPPLKEKTVDLRQSMNNTLERSDLPDDLRMKMYDQQFHKYDHFKEAVKSTPVNLVIKGDKSPTKKQDGDDLDPLDIIESVPKTMREKARWLVHRMKKSADIGWNNEGELVVDGTPVKGSHIVDLVNQTLRKRKRVKQLTGEDAYLQGLRRLHIPQEVVGNPDMWQRLTKRDEKDAGDDQFLDASNVWFS